MLRSLPLLIFLLPAVGVHLSLWISRTHALIPQCNVYLQGCASISAAGREEPAIFVFRAAVIPTAVLMMLFWHLSSCWLAVLGERSAARLHLIRVVGVVAGIFLILYAVFLGTEGDMYRLMRRYGVSVFFAFTYLAQLLVTGILWRHMRAGAPLVPDGLARTMFWLCVLMLGAGLASLPAAEWAWDRAAMNNIIEWNLAAVLMGWFILAWLAWLRTRFRVEFSARVSVSGS